MKVCVCGSRSLMDLTWEDVLGHVAAALADYNARSGTQEGLDLLIHGGARGIDTLAGEGAQQMGIPVQVFLPDWSAFGKGAGHMRNVKMAMEADLIVAIWDGQSTGTKHMISFCQAMKKELYIVRL